MQAVGLAGEGLVVSTTGPGIFLQGLTAYGRDGRLIAGGTLPPEVVRAAWEFAAAHSLPVCGFLEEECLAQAMHPELQELHHRWASVGLGGWVAGTCRGGVPAIGSTLCTQEQSAARLSCVASLLVTLLTHPLPTLPPAAY